MTRLLACCLGVWLIAAAGCSDPDRSVSASSEDGAFEVTLTAKKNWLRRGESLPVRVVVESLDGQLAETTRETLSFVVNNGTVSPSYLTITFVGRDDSATAGVEERYGGWITFVASPLPSSEDRQGEVHALFKDIQATLKVRILAD
jgi:hypothetical protein